MSIDELYNQEFRLPEDQRRKLSCWKEIAKREIKRWVEDDDYSDHVNKHTMKDEFMGPYTKFLYHFAFQCKCGWGVMVDFNERTQRIFLPDRYYKWMHKLRDEIYNEIEQAK